ncbi:2-C-methyl-D-erythritol 2,4-cyclodiphosphate synthase [Tranquillimonas rosea]|uniref:Bifunctional enzyme IspD/IspF n=1 Tax=Tranquillimonas rosea TaxID=641238 RepID=A0A1H9P6T1_9RHOB|nr:bifunctional 2-C-methyl-D-erythritol 4-phosphate cytidylyltransferase/2-C-methyl-D-erythritol 2,4-cyclodiphosphate synthase [Tranquillimonas rosea]SER44024.1 2-C-methyl-D-erythritol 2,4-cyclodiphosphate synthase [Tranquillimonas rosea]
MGTAAIIVAAGRGTRVGGPVAKQWRDLGGRSVARRAIDAFRAVGDIAPIVVVLAADDLGTAPALGDDVEIVTGGGTRAESVRAGLESLEGRGVETVLIHDVARPLVPAAVIGRVRAALEQADGAAPALTVSDALWYGTDRVTGTRDRTGLWRAQTPQGFRFAPILAAHRAHDGTAPDDVAVARAAGLEVAIVTGDEANLKITTEADFARAEKELRGDMDVRTGTGFDVHAFAEGDYVILCGVKVPHDRTLKGHSDADVGLHAVTDAIYGALADGDIGRHFPPSDPKWKGAASHVFLTHAAGRAAERGYRLSNVDCTLVCERPKIGPHAAAMAGEIARLVKVAPERVSVKATTSETLGFTGREEGIAALATVTLVAP